MRIGFAESIHNTVNLSYSPLELFSYESKTVLLKAGIDKVAKTNPDRVWMTIKVYLAILAAAISSFALYKAV